MATKIKALKPFVVVSSGALTSFASGSVASVADDDASALISAGLAEAYTLVTPTGTKEINSTAETDVAAYAKAQVVDTNLVAGNIKKDVTILGVTGTFE